MKTLKIGNVLFKPSEIIIEKKNDKIIINVKDINRVDYVKPNLLNYLVSSTWFGGTYPGRLQIHLNRKIGNSKLYLVRLKYKEFLELPQVYRKKRF